IGVAYFCGGIFPPKWFVGSLLHGISGLIVIFGSPIVFTLVSMGFVSSRLARPLIRTATLTWLSMALFYGSSVAFPRSGSSVVGWTNRILITMYVLWLLVAAFAFGTKRTSQRARPMPAFWGRCLPWPHDTVLLLAPRVTKGGWQCSLVD